MAASLVSANKVVGGSEHLLEIGFDAKLSGKQKDFRPELPLLFRW